MNKFVVILLLATLLSTVGCQPANTQAVPAVDSIPRTSQKISSETVLTSQPPTDQTWISPGKVNIGNFHEGATAEYPITIHNGSDNTAKFSVYYRIPDHTEEGYVSATNVQQNWIIVADSTPLLYPKETRDILVSLTMPKEAIAPAQKWEFWIGITKVGQTGLVQTELATRWLVTMRK